MNRKLLTMVVFLGVVFLLFLLLVLVGGKFSQSLQTGENPFMRFLFVAIGLLIAFGVYYATRANEMWKVGTREVVYMSIGAALYAVLSYLFNGTVFVVPSVSQVALRPAICIPMFFGYAFGPVVGLFTGAVGNMFGDALTGFGLYPQWSIGNGLIGFVAGMVWLFQDKKRSLNLVLIIGGALVGLATLLYILYPSTANGTYYDPVADTFGETPITIFAGISALVGFVLVLAIRFIFKDIDIAAAVTWGMLGNFIGMGFASISDIWVNGYSPTVAIVGEFLPSAGPNMIFAVILVPLLVVAYAAVRRQSGR